MQIQLPKYSPLARHWNIDHEVVFLNHGSFGATPAAILAKQNEYINRMEAEPVRFMASELEPMIWKSKEVLGQFIGAKAEDLVFVHNATTGVNTVLNSLRPEPEDEWLTTNHAYGACVNSLKFYADRGKVNIVTADIPLPIESSDEVLDAILKKITPKTKLVMIDHITSATGLLFPVEKIVSHVQGMGIDVLVDGAHAPGMVALDLEKINPAYYTGNCHKWICSPKGSAFLYVRKDRHDLIAPLLISHKYDYPCKKENLWSNTFFWHATDDYSPYLCVKDAIAYMGSLFPGGWKELREYNRNLCLSARKIVSDALCTQLPAPEEMIVNLSVSLIGPTKIPPYNFNFTHPLKETLLTYKKIEVYVSMWNRQDPKLWVRISSQCYNSIEQYEYLAQSLKDILKR